MVGREVLLEVWPRPYHQATFEVRVFMMIMIIRWRLNASNDELELQQRPLDNCDNWQVQPRNRVSACRKNSGRPEVHFINFIIDFGQDNARRPSWQGAILLVDEQRKIEAEQRQLETQQLGLQKVRRLDLQQEQLQLEKRLVEQH